MKSAPATGPLLMVMLLASPVVAFGQGAATEVHFPTTAQDQPLTLSGSLSRPDGPGPSPAMVLLHTCRGLAPFNLEYGKWLSTMGYVALVVNSFAARHQTNVCEVAKNPSVRDVAGDALGALAFLRAQSFVDASRVGVMGWSYGAMASLVLVSRSFIEGATPPGGGFRIAVALYPACRLLAADTSVPLLLLLGEADDWTPPAVCEAVAPILQQAGQVVEWHAYPGAYHAFDDDGLGSRTVTALGRFTLKYDPNAAADAHTRILDFLTKYLRGP